MPIPKLTPTLAVSLALIACNVNANPYVAPHTAKNAQSSGIFFQKSNGASAKMSSRLSPFKAYVTLKASQVNSNKSSTSRSNCLERLDVNFERPVNMASLHGRIYGVTIHKGRKPYYIAAASPDFRRFEFRLAHTEACPKLGFYSHLTVAAGVTSIDGRRLAQNVDMALPSSSFASARGSALMASPAIAFSVEKSSETMAPIPLAISNASTQAWWLRTSSASAGLSVSATTLNRAYQAVQAWKASEQNQAWYQGTGMGLVPLAGTVLTPYNPQQRKNHYSHQDLTFSLRKAAVFVAALYPQVRKIALADVSDSTGSTPSVSLGSEKIRMHPEGSHTHGKDADVSYITIGNGHEPKGAYDHEKNFWFLYSVLQSSGVDLVITAYKDEYIAIGRRAVAAGLITETALGRFNMLMKDSSLNHDKHMHISLRNADNNYRSQKFEPRDDVYTCYLALKPSMRGGNLNFCKA